MSCDVHAQRTHTHTYMYVYLPACTNTGVPSNVCINVGWIVSNTHHVYVNMSTMHQHNSAEMGMLETVNGDEEASGHDMT